MNRGNIKKKLLQTESPFTWNIAKLDVPIDTFIINQKEKSEKITDENEFKWTSFTLNLLLAYEFCETKKDLVNALQHINGCEEHLGSLTNIGCNEPLFKSIKPVLWHVTLATKAHILLQAGQLDQAELVFRKIKPLNPKYSSEEAGIYGVKAAFAIQYGTRGHLLALENAKKARDMDPEQAEWHFIVGNAMGRLRRTEYGKINPEEMESIEKAFLLQKDATYIVHLAQLYADFSSELFFKAKNNREIIQRSKKYAIKAVDRFKEAINIRPNCTSIKARVAHGLLRIRFKDITDMKYTKQLLDEVERDAPNNSMIHHDLGVYYGKFENNNDKALSYLQKSMSQGNKKALSPLIQLKWRKGLQQEIIGDLKGALEILKNKNDSLAETNVHLGSSYLLINNDWPSAIMHFNESLKLDPSAKYLKSYTGYGSKINLLEEMTNEVGFKMTTDENPPPEFKEFLDLSKSIQPSLFTHTARTGGFENWKCQLLKRKQSRK